MQINYNNGSHVLVYTLKAGGLLQECSAVVSVSMTLYFR